MDRRHGGASPLEDSTVWAAELGGSQDPRSGTRGPGLGNEGRRRGCLPAGMKLPYKWLRTKAYVRAEGQRERVGKGRRGARNPCALSWLQKERASCASCAKGGVPEARRGPITPLSWHQTSSHLLAAKCSPLQSFASPLHFAKCAGRHLAHL